MKYVVFLIDGMADYPLAEIGNKTPLEAARTPNINKMAEGGAVFGTFLSLPEKYPTSSDVANMSILGWDIGKYYTGRGAIESYGMGIPLEPDTVAFRLNLITEQNGILTDYSAGHIDNNESEEIINGLEKEFGSPACVFRSGVSYRNLLYLKGKAYSAEVDYEKPDSSYGKEWKNLLPRPRSQAGELTSKTLVDLIYGTRDYLKGHPVNIKRAGKGQNTANMIWPWSGGKKPDMPSFKEMYGLEGGIISAVDVVLGIGRLAGMEAVRPDGATGFIDTNYEKKAAAAVDILEKKDFVYVHIEAADECAHLGDLAGKIKVIEDCDSRLIGTFLREFDKRIGGAVRMAVIPDHPVPISLRMHTRDEVPFIISGPGVSPDGSITRYSERECLRGGYTHLKGREFMDLLFSDKIDKHS
jgi:2,3-bisphosphoglycerate-independent phosphoglycerate mutase